MSTLTIKATHIGPGFLQQIVSEFDIRVAGLDVTKPVPSYTFAGTRQGLLAMWRKYWLGDPNSTAYPGELLCP